MNDALDSLVGRADRALDTMNHASEQMSAIHVSRRSSDGLVVAEVDGTGALTGLTLASDLSRASASHLASTIVTTAAEASRDALEQRASVLEHMQSSLAET